MISRGIELVDALSIRHTPHTEIISVCWGFRETDNTTEILVFVGDRYRHVKIQNTRIETLYTSSVAM